MQIYKKIEVPTSTRTYDVIVGRDLIANLSSLVDLELYDQFFFVSDDNVWPIYGNVAKTSFENRQVSEFVFKAGEASKNPFTLVECLESMAKSGCSRDTLVITLGGGVACDLGGFAAATFMRGISVLQVPTSLLACVDASVGGKTAVDLRAGKNLFGAFHQPIAVVCDLDALKTLSEEQFRDSVGEVVKHSILADREMFEWLKNNKLDKTFVERVEMLELVARNVEIKRDVVTSDEFESGRRQTLNLGHTLGHAIETAKNFQVGHGTCVACGIALLVNACARAGITDKEVADNIIAALKCQGLPTETDVSKSKIIELIKCDKKRHGNSLNVVIVDDIESVRPVKMTFDEIEELLN